MFYIFLLCIIEFIYLWVWVVVYNVEINNIMIIMYNYFEMNYDWGFFLMKRFFWMKVSICLNFLVWFC